MFTAQQYIEHKNSEKMHWRGKIYEYEICTGLKCISDETLNRGQSYQWYTLCTVLVLIKLKKFAVALRLRCGSCK